MKVQPHHRLQRSENGLLNRMGDGGISLRRGTNHRGQNQHAGMLAAAIVVDAIWCIEGAGLRNHCRPVA